MYLRRWTIAPLPSFLVLCALVVANSSAAEVEGLNVLDGEWIYVEDRTEGRPLERLGPPMSSRMSMRVEGDVVILNGHGSGHRDVRVAIDGSVTEIAEAARVVRYQGDWTDGTFKYEVTFERQPDAAPGGIQLIRRTKCDLSGYLVHG